MNLHIDAVIGRYLALLDSQPWPDPLLCGELSQLYEASQRLQQRLFFAELAAPKVAEAASFLANYHAIGNIDLPAVQRRDLPPPSNDAGVVCAAANGRYFPILLNLIGSLHQHSMRSVRKLVIGDLGLSASQRNYLRSLARVEVLPVAQTFAFQQWKFPFVRHVLQAEQAPLLYLDAGCFVQQDLAPWFARLRHEGQLFWYNGPFHDPQHLTRNWTSQQVYQVFDRQRAQDDSVTAITTLFGLMPEREPWLAELSRYNEPWLLRPHADCIDNRFDQSLFAVWAHSKPELRLQRFEDELANAAGYGASQPMLTIHRSKFRPGEAFGALVGAAV